MPSTEFWTDRTAGWYARAIARSDFAERIFAAIGPALDGCRDALDVGAGCGALALPLARRLERVTALEPSPAMVRALERAAQDAGLHNIRVIEAAWGDVELPRHDLVVCAHVGELLKPGASFLAAGPALARRLVVLVRDAPRRDDQDKFFYRELYPLLLGRPYEHRSHAGETLAGLRALGIEPRTATVEYSSDQPFDSVEDACDFWMTYMGLEGPAPHAQLRRFLGQRLVRSGTELVAPFRKTATIFAWSPPEAQPRGPSAAR
jgi:SAM-dependent methyltransferase